MTGDHSLRTPEPTVIEWSKQLAPDTQILDIAAGGGRHALWLTSLGHEVTAIDRDTSALEEAWRGAGSPTNLRILQADLEDDPWPLPGQHFGAVVVVNYLWRALLPTLFAAIAPGGLLLYETFGVGNERYGRPRNPDYLLREGELQAATPSDFEILECAHGPVGAPPTAVRQRLLAKRSHRPG